jgi:hypothetical protein
MVYLTTLSLTHTIKHWMIEWLMNNKLNLHGRKRSCVTYGTVPAFARGAEENHKYSQLGQSVSGPRFETGTSRTYETGELTTRLLNSNCALWVHVLRVDSKLRYLNLLIFWLVSKRKKKILGYVCCLYVWCVCVCVCVCVCARARPSS